MFVNLTAAKCMVSQISFVTVLEEVYKSAKFEIIGYYVFQIQKHLFCVYFKSISLLTKNTQAFCSSKSVEIEILLICYYQEINSCQTVHLAWLSAIII